MNISRNNVRPGLLACFLAVGGLLALPAPDLRAQGEEDIAIGGYCPVAYHTQEKAVKGDDRFKSMFQGYVFLLSSAEAKKQFDEDPERYAPQFGGWCTTALSGYGNKIKSNPAVFSLRDGKLYLFSLVRARNHYDKNVASVLAKAAARWDQAELEGWCPASYLLSGKAVKGDSKYTTVYRGNLYRCASADAKKAFEQNASRFFPQFDGHGAYYAAQDRKAPADPTVFANIDGKIYLFFDTTGRDKFVADKKNMIKAANANWPKLRMLDD